MAMLVKLISQVILLVLPKIVDELLKKYRASQDLKKLETDNQKKGEESANANTVETARTSFDHLP
jgi:hypothetical protein